MPPKTFDMAFSGVDGGPCPSCGHSGLLLADRGVYGQSRTLRHLDASGVLQECTFPMSWGSVQVSPDGVWRFEVGRDER